MIYTYYIDYMRNLNFWCLKQDTLNDFFWDRKGTMKLTPMKSMGGSSCSSGSAGWPQDGEWPDCLLIPQFSLKKMCVQNCDLDLLSAFWSHSTYIAKFEVTSVYLFPCFFVFYLGLVSWLFIRFWMHILLYSSSVFVSTIVSYQTLLSEQAKYGIFTC